MTIRYRRTIQALTFASITSCACVALAQDAPADPPAAEAAPTPDADADEDGVRFRGGVSAGGGALILSGNTAGMGGVDGRLGVQIMDLIGIYVQPNLALGADSTFFAGSFGASLVADVTIIDHFFAGVGGGGGLVQYGGTEAGGVLHFRAGGYPLMGHGEDGIIRKGLMLGLDLRLHFAGGTTLISPMAAIGYEAF